jgi:hypothetical protein
MSDLFSLEPEPTVVLRPGIEVPLEVLTFGWDLETRGISLRLEGGDLVARPRQLLSDEDVTQLRRHAPTLKRLLRHTSVEVSA